MRRYMSTKFIYTGVALGIYVLEAEGEIWRSQRLVTTLSDGWRG